MARSNVPRESPGPGEPTATADEREHEPVDFEFDEPSRTSVEVPGIPEPVFIIGKSLLVFLIIIAILVLVALLTK